LIYKISSTCFGQYFVHHQERETEIFTAYGILQRRIYRNFLYIHLCRIPYAVNISVSRSWWWAKYCPKHV